MYSFSSHRESPKISYPDALMYAGGIFMLNGLQALTSSQYYVIAYHNAMKTRVAICGLMYRKVGTHWYYRFQQIVIHKILRCFHIEFSGTTFVTVRARWNISRQSGESTIEWCEPFWIYTFKYKFNLDCSIVGNYCCMFALEWNWICRPHWDCDHFYHCTLTKYITLHTKIQNQIHVNPNIMIEILISLCIFDSVLG